MNPVYKVGMLIMYNHDNETFTGIVRNVFTNEQLRIYHLGNETLDIQTKDVLCILDKSEGDQHTSITQAQVDADYEEIRARYTTPVAPINREFMDLHAQLHALNVERWREHMIDVSLASRNEELFNSLTQTT